MSGFPTTELRDGFSFTSAFEVDRLRPGSYSRWDWRFLFPFRRTLTGTHLTVLSEIDLRALFDIEGRPQGNLKRCGVRCPSHIG
jgi:hypothetical protein